VRFGAPAEAQPALRCFLRAVEGLARWLWRSGRRRSAAVVQYSATALYGWPGSLEPPRINGHTGANLREQRGGKLPNCQRQTGKLSAIALRTNKCAGIASPLVT